MNISFFNSKQPSQSVNLIFNFGSVLGTATLQSVTLSSFQCLNGIDPNINQMIETPLAIGSTTFTTSTGVVYPANTYATLTLVNGIAGYNYLVSVQGQTNIAGFTPVVSGILPVRQF